MNSEIVQLDSLTREDFLPRMGQRFRMHVPDQESLDLTLVEVQAHGHTPPKSRREGFSLLFRGEPSGHAPQAIYRLVHDEMGTLELFLVPIGPRDGGMCYEAVFN